MTLVAMLGLIVLAGFVGNAGHVVTTKVNTQNAADAVAFSSAQWMARGMNAATATNHLLGEVTGLVVVLEALGGPEADLKMEELPPPSKLLGEVSQQFKSYAPAKGAYGASALGSVEKPLINLLVDRVAPKDKKHKAWATIYDAKILLKKDLAETLVIKAFANALFLAPPPWGFLTAAIGFGIHLYMDVQLVEIGKEWLFLEAIEFLVVNPIVKELKVDLLEGTLIPMLAAHGDFIAGRLDKNMQQTSQAGPGIVSVAVGDSLLHLGKVYDVKAFTYPVAADFRIPIETEPKPSMKGSLNQPDQNGWGKDELLPLAGNDSKMAEIQEELDETKSEMAAQVARHERDLRELDSLAAKINELLAKGNEIPDDERTQYEKERDGIAASRVEKQKRLEKIKQELANIRKEEAEMKKAMEKLKNMPPTTGNLSAKRTHLALDQNQMLQSEERYTQWVRATYPYVDSFRAAILAQFKKHLERCQAAKHYEKWTNRYTLTKAWQFRSGYRFTAPQGSTNGKWEKKSNEKALAMYVMLGAYEKQTTANAGKRLDRKGHETWTLNTPEGKQQAERLFTVLGLTHRDIEPLFSPVIYPVASRNGCTTFAQAIYYNNNVQAPAPIGSVLPAQAKVGWDTLNWDSATTAPEWGAPPTESTAKWPWEIFTGDRPAGSATVKLNWQAKLMPVTRNRLLGATKMPMSLEMNQNVGTAYGLFNQMVTH